MRKNGQWEVEVFLFLPFNIYAYLAPPPPPTPTQEKGFIKPLKINFLWMNGIFPETFVSFVQRRLMKRRETVRLSCTKQMESARSSMRTTHPFHCPLRRLFTLISPSIWMGGVNVVYFVSLFINKAIHTTLWASQTSADHHEQGAWSATGARSLVKRCAHFIVPLLGNGIAYFLSTRNNPYFSKISFSKLIPLIKKKLRL